VLKDFSEEYNGEVDSSGTDLSVTFSIVGENPGNNDVSSLLKITAMAEQIKDTVVLGALEAKKIAVGAIKNSIGLL
jgi:hypothetical protein